MESSSAGLRDAEESRGSTTLEVPRTGNMPLLKDVQRESQREPKGMNSFDMESFSAGMETQAVAEPEEQLRPKRPRTIGRCVDVVQWLPVHITLQVSFIVPQMIVLRKMVVQRWWPDHMPACTDMHWGSLPCFFPTDDPITKIVLISSVVGLWCVLTVDALATGCSGPPLIMLVLYLIWVIVLSASPAIHVLGTPNTADAEIDLGLLVYFSVIVLVSIGFMIKMLKDWIWLARKLVSKKKKRFVNKEQDFDLDLSYITRNVIAMGWPAEGVLEAQYRNPMSEVQRFLKMRHKGVCKVYNVCSERLYKNPKAFEHIYADVRFPDHNPCKLIELLKICEDMEAWINKGSEYIAAVHCKAGKGRTGLVIASYMLHQDKTRKKTADQVLQRYAAARTFNKKGVTIPSQIRWVHLFEILCKEDKKLRPEKWLSLQSLQGSGFTVGTWKIEIYTHEDGAIYESGGERAPPLIEGDVKIVVIRDGKKLFHFWFHTAYSPELEVYSEEDPMSFNNSAGMLWSNPDIKNQDDQEAAPPKFFSLKLGFTDLDKKSKAEGIKKNCELRITFQEPSQLEAERESKSRTLWREQHSKEEMQQATEVIMKRNRVQVDSMDDVDPFQDDTDFELLLTSLQTGYLTRRRLACSAGERRWCVLQASGMLHLATGLDVFVVNLASRKYSEVFQKQDRKDGRTIWWVKHPVRGTWETIEAEPSESWLWEGAFADAIRLGEALRDEKTSFAGFFWKLNSGVDWYADASQRDFDFKDWRMRLFVLTTDGELCYYSWKDNKDVRVCSLGTSSRAKGSRVSLEGDANLTREAAPQWTIVEYIIPFVMEHDNGTTTMLAAPPKDVEVIMSFAGTGQRGMMGMYSRRYPLSV